MVVLVFGVDMLLGYVLLYGWVLVCVGVRMIEFTVGGWVGCGDG